MPADVAGNFSAASRVADVDCVPEVELFGEGREIVRIGIHVVAVPGLGGTAGPSPRGRYDPIAPLAEKHHLGVPVVRGERPAVAEHDGLACSPVLVENMRTIFGD